MKKKMIALLLAAAMVCSVTACGAKENNDNEAVEETVMQDADEDADEQEAETQIAEDATEENAEENADAPAADVSGDTLGQTLLSVFVNETSANAAATAQELAEKLITNEAILFSGGFMPVEPGLLTGFGNAEITGFKEGAVFMPMIGTIPFVGYVFTLEDGADTEGFIKLLTDNADPRWNICTEAEETVVESAGNKVFFLMCPKSLEE